MKKISFLSLIASILLLTSCDTTREIVINENGSGTYSNTIDLANLIQIAKMSGGGGELDEVKDKKMDTTISMASLVDSMEGLSADEKRIAKKGTMRVVMNIEDEKFLTKMEFPFASLTELATVTTLSSKAMEEGMKKQMLDKKGGASPVEDEDMPNGAIDQYFKYNYSKGLIQRTLNAEKYATVGDDKGMQSLKEMAEQGMPMATKTIIKLPKPAKKLEGKGAKLSDDKKTVTIEDSVEDFLDDGKALEFKVEY